MGRNRTFNRLSALALAAIMAVSLAVPALAYPGVYTPPAQYRGTLPGYVPMTVNYDPDYGIGGLSTTTGANGKVSYAPPYKITIHPGNYTATPVGDNADTSTGTGKALAERFYAYQIFAGSLVDDTSYPGYVGQSGYDSTENGKVADGDTWEGVPGLLNAIRWGKSVPEAKIGSVLDALIGTGAAAIKVSDVGITVADILAAGERYYSAFGGDEIVNEANTYPTDSTEGKNTGDKSDNEYWEWDESLNEGEGGWKKTGGFDTKLRNELEDKLKSDADEPAEGSVFDDLTLADMFKYALEHEGYKKGDGGWTYANGAVNSLTGTARVVAQVLSDFTPTNGNNNDLAEAFARILWDAKVFTQTDAEAHSTWNGNAWEIGNAGENTLSGGYYLIVDEYDGPRENDTALSDFMVGVYGDIEMNAKSEPPTVTKEISKNNGYDPLEPSINAGGDGNANQMVEGDSFEIGDEITFVITGTLPANYANYESYKYVFIDEMDDGLTYVDGTIQVYAKVRVPNPVYQEAPEGADNRKDWEKEQYLEFRINISELMTNSADATGAKFSVVKTGGDSATPETTLTITFEDLKKLGIKTLDLSDAVKANIEAQLEAGILKGYTKGADGTYDDVAAIVDAIKNTDLTIWFGSEFIITYKALLNENADPAANTNKVKLRYSSDPKDPKTTTETTPAEVYPYTLALDLLKYDGSKGPDTTVPGAGFSLSKTAAAGKQYALYSSANATEPAIWISEAELKYYLGEDFAGIADWTDLKNDDEQTEPEPDDTDTAVGKKLSEIAAMLQNRSGYTIGDVIPSTFSEFYLIPSDADPAEPTTRYSDTPTTYYAIVAKRGTDDGEYILAGWIADADLVEVYQEADSGRDPQPEDWDTWNSVDNFDEDAWKYLNPDGDGLTGVDVKDYLNPGFGASSNDRYFIVMLTAAKDTDNEGHLLIVGLDAGTTYTLVERIVPASFDELGGDITVEFTAEFYESTDESGKAGKVKSLTAEVGYDGNDNAVSVGNGTPGAENTYTLNTTGNLQLQMNVANYPDGYLPGTGGMGTYLFYIAGGVLLAGAALLLVLSNGRKKPGKQEEQ